MVMVFIQKFEYGITVILEKINGNMVIQNLVRPPLYTTSNKASRHGACLLLPLILLRRWPN